MSKPIRKFYDSITVSSGNGSLTTSADKYRPMTYAGGYIKQIIVTAPSPTDTFDFVIIDSDGLPIFRRKEATGEIVEERDLPVLGVLTLQITNAITDGNYLIGIKLKEEW